MKGDFVEAFKQHFSNSNLKPHVFEWLEGAFSFLISTESVEDLIKSVKRMFVT